MDQQGYINDDMKQSQAFRNICNLKKIVTKINPAKTFQMRKLQVMNRVLPKTTDEYEQRLHQRNEIDRLERSFYRPSKSKNKNIHRSADTKLNDQELSRNYESALNLNDTLPVAFPASFTKTEFKNYNTIQQGDVHNPGSSNVWTSKNINQLRVQLDVFKKKWQKMIDDEAKDEMEKKCQELRQGWVSFNHKDINEIDLESLEFVRDEYALDKPFRDYFELDRLLQRLSFFQRFSKSVRISILECSIYRQYQSGDYIYVQEEEDPYMYIIIRGSVVIRQKRMNDYSIDSDQIINSFYDGQQFGEDEPALWVDSDHEQRQRRRMKRIFSAIASESCYLLVMPQERFEGILYIGVENQIEKTVRTILSVSFLRNCPPAQLLPLTAVLKPCSFKMGEYLIRQGEPLLNMIIIMSGSCDVVYESTYQISDVVSRPLQPRFRFKEQKDSSTQYATPALGDPQRRCSYQYLVKSLKNGDVVGGRSLLSREDLQIKMSRNPVHEDCEIGKSKLSTVVTSAEVQVFRLEKAQFMLLPETLRNRIIQGIMNEVEYDEIPIKVFKAQQVKWNSMKEGISKKIIQQKLMRRQLGIL